MNVYKEYVTVLLLYGLWSYPYGEITMLNIKILYFLIALILGSYLILLVLSLHPNFKETYEEGAFLGFQNLLMMGVFFIICYGLWVNGYEERDRECQKLE